MRVGFATVAVQGHVDRWGNPQAMLDFDSADAARDAWAYASVGRGPALLHRLRPTEGWAWIGSQDPRDWRDVCPPCIAVAALYLALWGANEPLADLWACLPEPLSSHALEASVRVERYVQPKAEPPAASVHVIGLGHVPWVALLAAAQHFGADDKAVRAWRDGNGRGRPSLRASRRPYDGVSQSSPGHGVLVRDLREPAAYGGFKYPLRSSATGGDGA